MIIRNSVECAHCGEIVACSHMKVDAWAQHKCDEADFAISGGTEHVDRIGSPTDYVETSVFQCVAAVHWSANRFGVKYIGPEGLDKNVDNCSEINSTPLSRLAGR